MEAFLKEAIAHLRKRIPGLTGIYLFGSFGTPYARPESDIDLAFLADKSVDPVLTWEVGQELASKAGRDVDLVDLRLASTIMCYQVLTTGRRLYTTSPSGCDWFEQQALTSYLYFKEDRARMMDEPFKEHYG